MAPKHLYVHVPFCRSICYYCDFCHEVYQENKVDKWLDALQYELSMRKPSEQLDTIYIGGGTPTSLSDHQLIRLLELLKPYASQVQEYTVEVNPESISDAKIKILKDYSVNRVSIGIQTSNNQLLKEIGRRHTFEDVINGIQLLKENQLWNYSVDLMYGLPQQSLEDVLQSAKDVIALEPTHVSIYSLTIEENTVFGKRHVQPADSEIDADMYFALCKVLQESGYKQYEISNFAKEGYESKHNLAYWNYRDFYGFSCGASGKENHMRYDKPFVIQTYLDNPLEKHEIILSKEDEMFEFLMMGLRKVEGIKIHEFKERFGTDILTVYQTQIRQQIMDGFLTMDDQVLRCTEKGLPLLNGILEEFLP